VSVLVNDVVLTGAMDSVARCWIPEANAESDAANASSGYVSLESATIYDHEHWVTATLPIPAGVVPECPAGGFATGSMDKKIRVYSGDGARVAVLTGHEGGVTSLALSGCGKYLLSGSWDGTARVWDVQSKACVHVLPDHENGVCVIGLPNGTIVTGSTGKQVGNTVVDFKLRFWTNFALTKTLTDHQGPVRQLVLLPEIGFVSCSNDGYVILHM
jgi:phospholipase A-2-activating protein